MFGKSVEVIRQPARRQGLRADLEKHAKRGGPGYPARRCFMVHVSWDPDLTDPAPPSIPSTKTEAARTALRHRQMCLKAACHRVLLAGATI